jgi:3-deoxy-manno-octulosonate cytidylyltransferase (CMP-KDO synthetase)
LSASASDTSGRDAGFKVVIPARYASSRYPGKPLALLGGLPMIQRVWTQARASGAGTVVIATDDERIADAARSFGADVAMTDPGHRSGTDRVAEVAARRGWGNDAIIINVQGDAPLIPPASIRAVAELLDAHPGAAIATLCTPIHDLAEYRSPHVVKVVSDAAGRALYFSRAPIPAAGHGGNGSSGKLPWSWRHIGLYGYRSGALARLAATPPCQLEEWEQLEQLRALWIGLEIRVVTAPEPHGPDVDTPADLEAAEAWLRGRGEA